MNSKYKILISNTVIFAIGNILVKFISLVLMPLYTSILTTSQYGVAELLNNLVEIVLPISTLCIIDALYRFLIDQNANIKTLFFNSIFILLIGDIIVGIGCCIWYFLFNYQYAFYFFLLYSTTVFYKLTTQFARGIGHIKRYATYGIINSIILVFSNIILLLGLNGEIKAYLLSFSIGYGSTGIIAFIASKEYLYFDIKSYRSNTMKDMLIYSLPGIPNMLSWWINSLSDRYIINWIWGANIAGLYTAASKLPALINIVSSIFQQAWQYSTAKEINKKDNKVFFSTVFKFYAYICVVACAIIIILNKLICRILLQTEFFSAWKYVPFLLLAAFLGCISTYFGTFFNALKKNKILMLSTVIGAIFNISLNFLLIPKLGGMGAALATALSYFVIMIIRMSCICKMVNIDISKKRFFIQVFILSVSAFSGCFNSNTSMIATYVCFIILVFSDMNILKQSYTLLISLKKRIFEHS